MKRYWHVWADGRMTREQVSRLDVPHVVRLPNYVVSFAYTAHLPPACGDFGDDHVFEPQVAMIPILRTRRATTQCPTCRDLRAFEEPRAFTPEHNSYWVQHTNCLPFTSRETHRESILFFEIHP